MGEPGSGRNFLSQRFQRHFNVITYTELEDNSIEMIFTCILNYFLAAYKEEIKNSIITCIESTLSNYKEIKKTMLPTPGKMHYIFNLRDISKVLQGVSTIDKGGANDISDMARIWFHEMTRVFGDRLINDKDRDWLKEKLEIGVTSKFNVSHEELYKVGNRIIYCSFIGDRYLKKYELVTNVDSFISTINKLKDDYNEGRKRNKLDLVMFLDACDHVSRISRVLRQPKGNLL